MKHTQTMRMAVAVGLAAALLGGCQRPRGPVFEVPKAPLVWPAAPARPRIRYVGQLTKAADLKPPPKFLQGLSTVFVGPPAPQPLYGPRSVVVTRDGRNVWIADPGGRCVHGFDLIDRSYVKVIEPGGHTLLSPVDVARGPTGSIFVCDSEAGAIHRLDERSGKWIETLRLPEDIDRPVALYYDAAREELYVVDIVAHNIKVLDADSRVKRILGTRGNAPGQFNYPSAIVGDGDRLWVADTGNRRVQAISRTGAPIVAFGQAGDAPGDLALPKGLALDSDGDVYVVDARFENVQIFSPDGQLLLFFGEEGTEPGKFWLPAGLFIDEHDRIWVCDMYNKRVQVFDYLKEAATDDRNVPAPQVPSKPARPAQ